MVPKMYDVLIIEDDILESKALSKQIQESENGCRIVSIEKSGSEGVKAVYKLKPDLVILDINLPEMNGFEVLNQIKRYNNKIKTILITGYSDSFISNEILQVNADDFLLKPISPTKLNDSIKNITSRIRSKREVKFDDLIKRVILEINNNNYSNMTQALSVYAKEIYHSYKDDHKMLKKELMQFIARMEDVLTSTDPETKPDIINRPLGSMSFYKNYYIVYLRLKEIANLVYDATLEDEDPEFRATPQAILNYVNRNILNDLNLKKLRNYSGLSTYYLTKAFKKASGMNFVDYLTDKRVDIAKEMLIYTEIPIFSIAVNLSFREPNYFSKVFKKKTGLTPSQYRKAKKKKK